MSRRQVAGGRLQDLGQCKRQRYRPGQRLPGGGEGLRVRRRLGLSCKPLQVLFVRIGVFTLGRSATPCLRPLVPTAANHRATGFMMENKLGWHLVTAARAGWRTARSGATIFPAFSLKTMAPRPRRRAASAREEGRGCFLGGSCISDSASPSPPCLSYSRPFSKSPGRIYDGKEGGVAFIYGGKGQVEGCQIWGNETVSVFVQGDGSEAVMAGCKCAGGRARVLFLEARAFLVQ